MRRFYAFPVVVASFPFIVTSLWFALLWQGVTKVLEYDRAECHCRGDSIVCINRRALCGSLYSPSLQCLSQLELQDIRRPCPAQYPPGLIETLLKPGADIVTTSCIFVDDGGRPTDRG